MKFFLPRERLVTNFLAVFFKAPDALLLQRFVGRVAHETICNGLVADAFSGACLCLRVLAVLRIELLATNPRKPKHAPLKPHDAFNFFPM
jgi:hypothetical protein